MSCTLNIHCIGALSVHFVHLSMCQLVCQLVLSLVLPPVLPPVLLLVLLLVHPPVHPPDGCIVVCLSDLFFVNVKQDKDVQCSFWIPNDQVMTWFRVTYQPQNHPGPNPLLDCPVHKLFK